MTHSPRTLPRRHRAVAFGCAAAVIGAVGLFAAGSADAALPTPDQTAMTSVTPAATPTAGSNLSSESSVSSDGRYVAFTSFADDLTPVGVHGKSQVYKRDMLTGTTTLVSAAQVGADSGTDDSSEPSISADGRYVSFTSTAHNLAAPANILNDSKQVYVRDTVAGATRVLSVTPGLASEPGGGDSEWSSISADGSKVVFQSAATNLLATITPSTTQVYVAQNAADPSVQIVSVRDGAPARLPDKFSEHPAISGDGGSIAFVSAASDFTRVGGNGKSQVYVRKLDVSKTKLLTIAFDDAGAPAGADSDNPSISFDGATVAYQSTAKNLVPQDINSRQQIFVHQSVPDKNVLVSFERTNVAGAGEGSAFPAISADGRKIAFSSLATDILPINTSNKAQIYVRDLDASSTKAVSLQVADPASGGAQNSTEAAISGDGNCVAFTSMAVGLTAIPTLITKTQTYLRAVGAVVPPTPTPTPTGGTTLPTGTPSATAGPGATGGTTGGGQGGSGTTVGGHLASTGLSQAPIIAAAVCAALVAVIGASILLGSGAMRRRRLAATVVATAEPKAPLRSDE